MPEEITAFKFKLNTDALPHAARHLKHGFAVKEFGLNAMDNKAKPPAQQAKDEVFGRRVV